MHKRMALLLCSLIPFASAIGQTPPSSFTTATASSQVVTTGTAGDGVTVIGYDAQGRAITSSGPAGTFGFRYATGTWMDQFVDRFGNQVFHVTGGGGLTSQTIDTPKSAAWSSFNVTDANGDTILQGVDWESSSIGAFAADLNVPLGFPDVLEIAFNGAKTISAVRVYTLQDNYGSPVEPTPSLRFSQYGVTDFEVQYWYDGPNVKKWVVVPNGVVVSNRNVMRTISFPAVTTTKVRLVVKNALQSWSRLVEVEAFDTAGVNVALQLNGGVATGSSTLNSGYPASGVNNGDRRGVNWGAGGGWHDATGSSGKLAGATATETSDAYNRYLTYQNAFAKVTQTLNLNPPPYYPPPAGQPYHYGNELTEMKGKVFRAWLAKTNRGTAIWDNQGGSQWFGHDSSGRLQWVADTDYIIKIARDDQGRIVRIYLGDTAVLRFVYDANGLYSKEFIDLRTNLSASRFTRPNGERKTFGRTREALEAFLPGVGTVAELDKTVTDRGLVVAKLFDRPYALIPFEHSGPTYNWHMPVRWIITLPKQDTAEDLLDRIEYNENEIIVRMSTWREMPGTPRHTIAFSLPRKWSSPMPITFRTNSSVIPTTQNMQVALSAGFAENGEPDNDDVFHEEIFVTAVGDPPPPPPNVPPIDGDGGAAGGGGNGSSGHNPFNRRLLMEQRAKIERARNEAIRKLSSGGECPSLFQKLKNVDGAEQLDPYFESALRTITNITNGNDQLSRNGEKPCSNREILMWMDGIKQSTLYVCSSIADKGDPEITDAFIHEMLHAAGLRESNSSATDHKAKETHTSITTKVANACR